MVDVLDTPSCFLFLASTDMTVVSITIGLNGDRHDHHVRTFQKPETQWLCPYPLLLITE